MKKLLLLTLAAAALLPAAPARAWTYNDGDLLLVFRQSSGNDVEFDLGTVSNYLGHAAGYTTNVIGWDTNLVASTFSGLSGVKVVLLAATTVTSPSPAAWLSGAEPDTTAYTVSAQAWSSRYQSIIHALGTLPAFYGNPGATNYAAGDTNAYVIATSTLGSYDNTVSGGTSSGLQDISQLGGHANFTVEDALPADLDFWQIAPSSASPKPADQFIGRFEVGANGVITFIAGPRPSLIQGVSRSGSVSSVQFTTTLGSSYTLAHTNLLTAPLSAWPVDTTAVTGDGNTDTITHTNSGSAEYYEVIAH